MLDKQEYSFKIMIKYEDSDEFEELKNVSEFSIIEELDSLQKTLRITLFAMHLQKMPELLAVEHLWGRADIFKVEQTGMIDLYKKEIIAKTPLNIPDNFDSIEAATAELGVECEVGFGALLGAPRKCEYANIASVGDFERVLDECGGFWYYDEDNKLIIKPYLKVEPKEVVI